MNMAAGVWGAGRSCREKEGETLPLKREDNNEEDQMEGE